MISASPRPVRVGLFSVRGRLGNFSQGWRVCAFCSTELDRRVSWWVVWDLVIYNCKLVRYDTSNNNIKNINN